MVSSDTGREDGEGVPDGGCAAVPDGACAAGPNVAGGETSACTAAAAPLVTTSAATSAAAVLHPLRMGSHRSPGLRT
jgi:hypothetical protein